jgi:hypothetical protein
MIFTVMVNCNRTAGKALVALSQLFDQYSKKVAFNGTMLLHLGGGGAPSRNAELAC